MGRKVGPVQLDSTWREQCFNQSSRAQVHTRSACLLWAQREEAREYCVGSLRSSQWCSLEMAHVAAGEKAGSQKTGGREQTLRDECVCRHGLSTCR